MFFYSRESEASMHSFTNHMVLSPFFLPYTLSQDGSLKQCEEPFTLITPHVCTNLKKAEGRLRKGK